jgi:hypothetical protein
VRILLSLFGYGFRNAITVAKGAADQGVHLKLDAEQEAGNDADDKEFERY